MNRQQRFSPILSFSPTQLFPLLCTRFLVLYNLIWGFLVLLLRLLESFLIGPYLSHFLTCFSNACGLLVSSLSRIFAQDNIDFQMSFQFVLPFYGNKWFPRFLRKLWQPISEAKEVGERRERLGSDHRCKLLW